MYDCLSNTSDQPPLFRNSIQKQRAKATVICSNCFPKSTLFLKSQGEKYILLLNKLLTILNNSLGLVFRFYLKNYIPALRRLLICVIYLAGIHLTVQAQSTDPLTNPEYIFQQADDIPSLRSLLIQQHGELVGEDYFEGRSPNRPYNIKSASKSIISLLIGIAIDHGFINGVDEPIGPYFSEYFKENPSPQKESLTIRQLLSMQAGLESTSIYNYGRWVISDDWVKYQLDREFVEEPGGRMVYSTGISHLLSVILTKATGMSTKAFAQKYLFSPLDIRIGGWDRDPQGYYMGGNNLAMKPGDMLKIGQMILDEGEYKEKRIVSREWIRDSFRSYTRSNYNPYNYGYMWWNQHVGGYPVFFAWGFGGQYIFIIPDLDAVVVVTSASDHGNQDRSYKADVFGLLEHHLIPFLEASHS